MNNFKYSDPVEIEKLNNYLLAYPESIYQAEIKLANAIEASSKANLELELEEAGQFLIATGKTVKEKEAYITQRLEVQLRDKLKKDILELKAKAEYNKQKNGFDALRKVAGNVEARLKAKL